jgi:hypothetical protein
VVGEEDSAESTAMGGTGQEGNGKYYDLVMPPIQKKSTVSKTDALQQILQLLWK